LRALFEIDAAMGDVVARSTDPALGRIKLAWWREQLEGLDSNAPPAEPRLNAVADRLLPLGVKGAELAELEVGWAALLDDEIDWRLVAERGETLFRLGGRLLGVGEPKIAEAGAIYALAAVGRRGVPELCERAKQNLQRLRSHRFDRKARPLTMLTRAAVLEGAQRGLGLAMLAHRWSGRIG
jgi:phytoene synthase